MPGCSNNGHFGIVASSTHIITLLSRNGEPRGRWGDNVKMVLREVGCGGGGIDWIKLAQDRDRRRALVNAVMKLRVT